MSALCTGEEPSALDHTHPVIRATPTLPMLSLEGGVFGGQLLPRPLLLPLMEQLCMGHLLLFGLEGVLQLEGLLGDTA